jgi:pimeloyl-ACP methyl ester carboxylesterase
MPKNKKGENPVITTVAAHYCGPWQWDKYFEELMFQRGYEVLSPGLPIDDPDMTLDDHAEILRNAQEERGAAEYVDIGHSWGGDVIYRKLGRTPVSMLVFQSAPLRPIKRNLGLPSDELSSRSLFYGSYINLEETQATGFDREWLGQALFSDLGDCALQAWATEQLQSHPHKPHTDEIDEQAVLPAKVKLHYVGTIQDRIFKYLSQKQTAEDLGINFTSIDTSHFPMLEKPLLYVEHIIKIIELAKRERQQILEAESIELVD